MAGVVIVVAFLLVFGAVRSVVIVPNQSAYVVERLGRYLKTLPAGFNLIVPVVDRVAFKHALTVQAEELSDVYETKDQRRASLTSAFRFRVLDPQLASYGAADYLQSLQQVVRTSQKRYVERQTWDSLREDTRSLQSEVLRNVEAPAATFGVRVTEYEVRNLKLA